MTKYRIRVGAFDSELNQEELTLCIEEALEKFGVISEVENRGLLVSEIRHGGRQGEVNIAILRTILDADQPLSLAKIGRALPQLDPKQIANALSRMSRNGEVTHSRTNRKTGKYWYYVYQITEKGGEKLVDLTEARTNAKANALAIWGAMREIEYKVGDVVNVNRILRKTGMTKEDFRFAWTLLAKKDRVHRIYPGEPGSTNRLVKYVVGPKGCGKGKGNGEI